jgi:hypothetical protein
MRVILRFHHAARAGLLDWRQSLGRDERERRRMYRVQMATMEETFSKHEGFPPEAFLNPTTPERTYWWQFSTALRIEYIVYERPKRPRGWWDIGRIIPRGLGLTVRTVLVIAMTTHLPRS